MKKIIFKKQLCIEDLNNNNWKINTDRIFEITNVIINYQEYRRTFDFSKEKWDDLCAAIVSVLYSWTGSTYVGINKTKKIKSCFQYFFENIKCLIINIDNGIWQCDKREKEFASAIKYQGLLYRVIGSAKVGNRKVLLPQFNWWFVSWSKNEKVSYLFAKLYGPITWMMCETLDNLFGIDIEGFQNYCRKYYKGIPSLSRGEEREVVFYTNDSCIKSIQIFEYDEDGNMRITVKRK